MATKPTRKRTKPKYCASGHPPLPIRGGKCPRCGPR